MILFIISAILAFFVGGIFFNHFRYYGEAGAVIGKTLGVYTGAFIIIYAILNYIVGDIISGLEDIFKIIVFILIIIIFIAIDFFVFTYTKSKNKKTFMIVALCILILIEGFIAFRAYKHFFDSSKASVQLNNNNNNNSTTNDNNISNSNSNNSVISNNNATNNATNNTTNSITNDSGNQANTGDSSNINTTNTNNNQSSLLNNLCQSVKLTGTVANTNVTINIQSTQVSNGVVYATEKYSGCNEVFNLKITEPNNDQLKIEESSNGEKTGEYTLSYNQSSNQLFGTFKNQSTGKVSNAVFSI